MSQDTIEIEILPDGTIKTSTDKISGANHNSAATFIKEVARLAGGTTEVKSKHAAVFTVAYQQHEADINHTH